MPQQPRNILDAFARKKAEIVKKIAEPIYTDRSPQGYIDLGIRDLIDDINSQHGLVTTSSCAGRVSVFVEGRKKLEVRPRADDSALSLKDEEHQSEESHLPDDLEVSVSFASTGGKGASGKWLWVSHEPIVEPTHQENIYFSTLFGLSTEVTGSKQPAPKDVRYVHFKFEPMILHVWTASLMHANMVLSAAIQAGFRESGAVNIDSGYRGPPMPMVGIRCHGLALDSIVGLLCDDHDASHHSPKTLVTEDYLRTLVAIANDRFAENSRRTKRFREELIRLCHKNAHTNFRNLHPIAVANTGASVWEDSHSRRERKREEGLKKQALRQMQQLQPLTEVTDITLPEESTEIDLKYLLDDTRL